MRYWPRRPSVWDGPGTAPSSARSGQDPINPARIAILRRRGMTYAAIGALIAKQDGRKMPYKCQSVFLALKQYRDGLRDEDGERT